MKKLTLVLISIGLCYGLTVNAADLKSAFTAAQQSDPTYLGAEATYKAAYATLDISRGALLPNLALTGSWMHSNMDTNTEANFGGASTTPETTNTKVPANALAYTLTLTQPLFNWQAFAAYSQVKATVKQAAATYAASAQDLISRVANAYFAVLHAQEVLRYTEAQKAALSRQLQVAKQRYQVGLDPITSVYDAQAQYDSTSATYIANQNTLANQNEALREITGQLYPKLARLKDDLPLLEPQPANIDDWTNRANQQNALLQAQRFAVLAAEKNIKVQSAQHLPVLNLTGTYTSTKTTQTNYSASQTISGPAYGVGVALPIYSGGSVNAETEQAQYQYQAAIDAMEFTHRQTVANTRTAYLSVVAEISQIEADKQAIKSAAAALASNEAGYRVGTQTIVDVLTAQTNLYQAQTQYAQDRYAYITNLIALKEAAGSLSLNDVDQINAWLTDAPYSAMPSARIKKLTRKAPEKKMTHAVKKQVSAHHTKKTAAHKSKVTEKHVKHHVKKPVKKATPIPTTDETNSNWNN